LYYIVALKQDDQEAFATPMNRWTAKPQKEEKQDFDLQ
jgi:hypothetical protein